MTPSFHNWPVARRVTALAIALVAAVLVLVGLTISGLTERTARAQVVHSVGETTATLANALGAADATNRELVQLTMKGFQLYFDPNMKLDATSGELRSFGSAVKDEHDPVDRFASETGGIAKIFSRTPEGFKIISSSLKGADGVREAGCPLTGNPLRAALAGKAWIGRMVIQDKPYMGYYLPVLSPDGDKKPIAVLFIANYIGVMERMQHQLVAQTQFFEHGGIYVIDPRDSLENAVFLVHASAAGKRVLEVFPDARPFLEKLAQAPDGFVREAPSVLDDGGPGPWALLRKPVNDSVWVVAEVPDGEAMASQKPLLAAVWSLVAMALALMAMGLYWLLRRSVAKPISELTETVTRVSDGDLTQPVHTLRGDEIGLLMRGVEGMRQRYKAVLQEVHLAVAGITGASSEIANGNQDLSARTELAASNLQQTAHSMDELTASVRRSAQSAEQANRLAGHAGEVAALGGSQVAEVVATMGEIHESSRRIQDIIGVIDGIAFQTNILALNAAVEAARAGEQGRGFAVVASEVRALAGRSADAAKEIKALIGASASKANAGAQRVQQAGATVGDIVRSVRQVETIVGEITATTSEQSGGIVQVNLAMAQLEQATQQNAALVEQSTAAAQSLRDQANRLAAAVAVFKVTDEYPARVFPDSALATTLRLSGSSESP